MNLTRLLMIPVALLAAAAVTPAHALTIKVFDGTNTMQVSDGNASDQDSAANAVEFDGTIGVWTINVQFSESNAPGDMEGAFIHSTTSLRASGAGFLEITIWDTFTTPLTDASLVYGSGGFGTNAGTITGFGSILDAESYIRTDDCVRAITGSVCATSLSHGQLPGAYVMTMFQRIEVAGSTRSFSIDSDVYNVPEPGTLALFGLGLVGLGFTARRRQPLNSSGFNSCFVSSL